MDYNMELSYSSCSLVVNTYRVKLPIQNACRKVTYAFFKASIKGLVIRLRYIYGLDFTATWRLPYLYHKSHFNRICRLELFHLWNFSSVVTCVWCWSVVLISTNSISRWSGAKLVKFVKILCLKTCVCHKRRKFCKFPKSHIRNKRIYLSPAPIVSLGTPENSSK